MGRFSLYMRRFGTRSTQFVGKHWGERFPFYYVTEFPRSGGTWLSRMIADYLQIPKPTKTVFPMGCSCVIQNHWGYSPKLRRVFYLYRDGRDVCTSAYFHMLHGLHSGDQGVIRYLKRLYPDADKMQWTVESSRDAMPRFVERWCQRPPGSRISWKDHVNQWTRESQHVVVLSYEELLADCAGTLHRVIPVHTGEACDPDRIEATVEKFSFQKQTGRQPGEASPLDHNRKGIAGDWKNHFNAEATDIFNHYCGEELRRLGYADDSHHAHDAAAVSNLG